jgi:4-alpha-glucanotransferase
MEAVEAAVPSPTLVELARAHGVATDYWDWQGRHVPVPAATIRKVLGALGIAADTEEETARSLEAAAQQAWRRILPATVVCREGWTPWVAVHVPHGTGVWLEVELEGGGTRPVPQVDNWVEPRSLNGTQVGEATFELPGDLPLGWHVIRAHLEGGADETGAATLVVTPQRLHLPAVLEDGRVWGLMEQVYQVRSDRSWGIGDLSDLADLAAWAGEDLGADFVLVNPLHAAEPVPPMEASPYLPTTRRFTNPIYLHVEDIPEMATLDSAARTRVEAAAARARALSERDTIDRDEVWGAKRSALWDVFQGGLVGRRARDFARYCRREGEGLLTFATWCALAEVHGLPWTTWPLELQDPASGAVMDFRQEHREAVDFHRWLQWLLDGQLSAVQRDARAAGMSLGIVHDLAVGVNPHGADAWGLADTLARGVSVGAPPDQFNQLGQDWSQPPWRPDRLAERGYAPYRDMLRTVLRDSGGIRVDHIIGLFRLWWVPEGQPASLGTYVRYDHEALVGILALEAHRAGAVVVGEDLGVVEPWARDYMRERGILGTSILWFEWGPDGQPLPAEHYRELCLSTVTTHDLPPTAGYLGLMHVALRERLGLLTRPVAEERAVEEVAIATVREMLVSHGLLGADAGVADTVEALHRCLAQTPSRMLGVAVTDLVGDVRSINQPGTRFEYPNWCLPIAGADGRPVGLEQVMASPLASRLPDVFGTTG